MRFTSTPPSVRMGMLFAAMLTSSTVVLADDDDEDEKPLTKPSTEMTTDLDTYGEESSEKAEDTGEPLSSDVLDEDDQLKHPIDGTVREPGVDANREELDEAADALLQKSFSQPGNQQNSGWNGADPEKAKVKAPEEKSLGKRVQVNEPKPVHVEVDPDAPLKLDRADIINVQRALMKVGHKLRADGKFGDQTRTAIKDFQKAQGLNASGDVDHATMDKLGLGK